MFLKLSSVKHWPSYGNIPRIFHLFPLNPIRHSFFLLFCKGNFLESNTATPHNRCQTSAQPNHVQLILQWVHFLALSFSRYGRDSRFPFLARATTVRKRLLLLDRCNPHPKSRRLVKSQTILLFFHLYASQLDSWATAACIGNKI